MVAMQCEYCFTRPYNKDDTTNILADEVSSTAARLYSDNTLLEQVDALQTIYTERKECLLHNDLHTASVMVKDGDVKVSNLLD